MSSVPMTQDGLMTHLDEMGKVELEKQEMGQG
jgi:hypothetical protein